VQTGTTQLSSQEAEPTVCSLCKRSGEGGLLQCECCSLWNCSKFCLISDEAMAIIGELDSIHSGSTMRD